MPDAHLQRLMVEQHIPGLALIVQAGETRLYEGYHGFANLEHRVPVISETVFEIASVTKLFTTQIILSLVQGGQLDLDSRLIDHLPEFIPTAWAVVTVRHVLTHQSGIPDYTNPPEYWALTRRDKTHAEVLALVNEQPLKFTPGSRNSYDNTGFYLLGLLIESICGESYADVLGRVIFKPMGMTRTRANDNPAIIPNRAQGYLFENEALHNKPFYSTSNTFSAGCAVSTAGDLIRWTDSLFNDTILEAHHRELWWQPNPSEAGNERHFNYTVGLGWFRLDTPLGMLYGHNGGIAGFASAYMHFPATGITAVALCNAGHIHEPHTLAFAAIQAVSAG